MIPVCPDSAIHAITTPARGQRRPAPWRKWLR